MIYRDIIEWVEADDAAKALRQEASWLRDRDPKRARDVAAKAAAAQAKANMHRDRIIGHRGENDRPSPVRAGRPTVDRPS
jgi:hypothetical protein